MNVQGTISFNGANADVPIPVNPTSLAFSESVNIGAGASSSGGDVRLYYVKLPVESVIGFRRNSNGQSGRMDVLCYWNGSEWIVDDVNSSTTTSGTFLKAKTPATYFVAFRPENNITSFVIGQPIPANGANIDAKLFGYSMSSYTFTADDVNFPTTLTFPSSNGFDCFEPGDVVQPEIIVGDFISKLSVNSGTLSDASKNNAFDGDINTECTGPNEVSMITFDLSASPISYKSKVEIYTASPYDEGRINDNAFVDMARDAWTTLATGSGVISKIDVKDDTAKPVWTAIKVDGKYLIDSTLVAATDFVKVISKDEDANTITVDGGNWTGSDGSGTPGEQNQTGQGNPLRHQADGCWVLLTWLI